MQPGYTNESEENKLVNKRSTFNHAITLYWLGLTAHLQNFSSYKLLTSFTLNPKLILVVPLTVGNTIPEGQTRSVLRTVSLNVYKSGDVYLLADVFST